MRWEERQPSWQAFADFVRMPANAEIVDGAIDELVGAAAGKEERARAWRAMVDTFCYYHPFKAAPKPGTRRIHVSAAARNAQRRAMAATSALEKLEKRIIEVDAALEAFPQQLLPDSDMTAAAQELRAARQEQIYIGLRHQIGPMIQWLTMQAEFSGKLADYIEDSSRRRDRGGPGLTLEHEARGSTKSLLILSAAMLFNEFRPNETHAGPAGPFFRFAGAVLELMTGIPGEEKGQGLLRHVQDAVTAMRIICQ